MGCIRLVLGTKQRRPSLARRKSQAAVPASLARAATDSTAVRVLASQDQNLDA